MSPKNEVSILKNFKLIIKHQKVLICEFQYKQIENKLHLSIGKKDLKLESDEKN